jgi:uncharacterized protein (TIGR02246 family)
MVLAIALMLGLGTPALAQKTAIEAANAKFVELFNKGDFNGVANLYTGDAVVLPPGAAVVKGRTAIAALWKGVADQVSDPRLTTVEVKRIGRLAVREVGTYSMKTKGAAPKEITGKYLVIWEKVGPSWKLSADTWNDGN